MINILPILVFFLSHCVVVTQAWGTLGHEIVGNLAWYHLSEDAKSWVNDTLEAGAKGNHLRNHEEDPTLTPLGKVADWADNVRHYLGWSAPLHFIDVRDDLIPGGCMSASEDCRFQYDRDCVNDICAAGAILNYTQQLLGSKPTPGNNNHLRRYQKGYNLTQALMFLTHFIGDIHQPLHASRTTDKGGNNFHVHFSLPDDALPVTKSHHHSWNLHSVWDTAMIEVVMGRNYNHSRHLMEQDLFHSSYDASDTKKATAASTSCNIGINATCVIAWGEQSFDLALKYAYVESDNVTQVVSGSTLDELYYESRLPIIKQQLILGGIRLADTIEAIVAAKKNQESNKESVFGAAPLKLSEVWKTLGLATVR
ncbi:MAG: hypothetical protein SGBAC_006997 [Bacillariaceae sp.]